MATTEKKWHKNFLKYMKKIIEHDNYKGLPIQKKPTVSMLGLQQQNRKSVKKELIGVSLKDKNLDL